MPRLTSIAVSTGLIGTGALICVLTGRSLLTDAEFAAPLNILGINGSPYGEVFAMAMQEPIDTYFHHSMVTPGARTTAAASHEDCGLADCDEHDDARPESTGQLAGEPASSPARLRNLLRDFEVAANSHTNPRPPSEAQKRHLRRQVEDKLRFAYQLDPSHYGNYNSYHFFLVEPALGTRPQLTPGAAKLAEETIQFCLKEPSDPRPALTAAAAATNILHLMFGSGKSDAGSRHTPAQMREVLALLDHCLARHFQLVRAWEASGEKELVSPLRLFEMEERLAFIMRIREAAEGTIRRLEGSAQLHQASN